MLSLSGPLLDSGVSDTELKKQLKIVKAKRRKKIKIKEKKRSVETPLLLPLCSQYL